MCKLERGHRPSAAALSLAAAYGAMILVLAGCGQSGPLYLPKESALATGVATPVTESGATDGWTGGTAVVRSAAVRRARA